MTTQTPPSSTGAATATPATPPTWDTLSTPLGPITWEKASDGSVTAVGNGQKFTSHGSVKSDGSWAQQANYAKTGQTSYLAMGSTGDVAGRKVQLLISAGSSRLTLTVSNIDAGGASGTATLSGIWNGAVVQWTGHVNLTSNPFVGNPIAGWPKGAFATELQMAAFFAPLGNVLAQVTPRPPAVTPKGPTLQPRDEPTTPTTPGTQDILVQAGWACLGAMLGAGVTGPASMGLTLALACAGGAIASVGSNINTWVNNNPPPVAEPPPISLPGDPEPTGPITQTQPDDPPPPPPGDDDGSGSQSSTGSNDGSGAGDGDDGGDGGGEGAGEGGGGEGGEGAGEGGEGEGGGEGGGGEGGGGGGGRGGGIDDNPPMEQD